MKARVLTGFIKVQDSTALNNMLNQAVSFLTLFVRGRSESRLGALSCLRFIVDCLPLITNVDDVPESGTRPISSIFFTVLLVTDIHSFDMGRCSNSVHRSNVSLSTTRLNGRLQQYSSVVPQCLSILFNSHFKFC